MEFVGPVAEVTIDCEHILRTLPEWFGIEESLTEYVADTQRFPTFVVRESEQVVGFITARQRFESAWEIHCLAVERTKRGTGVGRLLVKGLEEWLHTKQAKYVQVKTIAENHPSAEYAETRAFYNKMGYEPLEVFTEIWGTANPCLQLIKRLPGANVLARPCDYARDIERVIALLLNYHTADADAIWITEVWDSQASHQASLSLPAVQEAIAQGRPLIAGFGERFVTEPVGGRDL